MTQLEIKDLEMPIKKVAEKLKKLQFDLNQALVDFEEILNTVTQTNDSSLMFLVNQVNSLNVSMNILNLIKYNLKEYATSWDSRKDIILSIKSLSQ